MGLRLFPINDNTITSRSATNMLGEFAFFTFHVWKSQQQPGLRRNPRGLIPLNPVFLRLPAWSWVSGLARVPQPSQGRVWYFKTRNAHLSVFKKKKKKKTFLGTATRRVSDTFVPACFVTARGFHPFCVSAGGSPGALAENTDKWSRLQSRL